MESALTFLLNATAYYIVFLMIISAVIVSVIVFIWFKLMKGVGNENS